MIEIKGTFSGGDSVLAYRKPQIDLGLAGMFRNFVSYAFSAQMLMGLGITLEWLSQINVACIPRVYFCARTSLN